MNDQIEWSNIYECAFERYYNCYDRNGDILSAEHFERAKRERETMRMCVEMGQKLVFLDEFTLEIDG